MKKTRCMGSDEVKHTWDYFNNNLSFDAKDPYGLISWPPTQYTCSFCRRKFKSAQALGGHMNVHRRDRAMLRQSPSWLVESSNPNSNPSPKYSSPSPSSPTLPPCNCALHTLLSPSSFSSPSLASNKDEKMAMILGSPRKPSSPRCREISRKSLKGLHRVGLESFKEENEFEEMNNGQIIRLDLEIGLIKDNKEDLDLELRLGYS